MDGLINKIVTQVMNDKGPRTIISKQVKVDNSSINSSGVGNIHRPNYQKQKAEQRLLDIQGKTAYNPPSNERSVNKAAYQPGNVGATKTGYGSGSMSKEPNKNVSYESTYQPGNVGPTKTGYGPASMQQQVDYLSGTSNLQLMGYNQTVNAFDSSKTSNNSASGDFENAGGFEKTVVQAIKTSGHGPHNGRKVRGTGDLLGVAKGATVGYVIPNLDPALRKQLNLDPEIRAIGILSSRFGSAPQIMAADEAVKKTNSKILQIQFSRDGKDNYGHGVFILLGSDEVAEVTDAIEIALNATNDFYNGIYEATNGRIEVHFTARAAEALNFAFKAPMHRAFGILIGSPAGIGLIMSDVALKTANVDVTYFWGPSTESAFANEVWLMITGDSAAVKNALEAAAEVGQEMIKEL